MDRFDTILTAWESTRSGQLPSYPDDRTCIWFVQHPDIQARWYPLALWYDRALFSQPAWSSTAYSQTAPPPSPAPAAATPNAQQHHQQQPRRPGPGTQPTSQSQSNRQTAFATSNARSIASSSASQPTPTPVVASRDSWMDFLKLVDESDYESDDEPAQVE